MRQQSLRIGILLASLVPGILLARTWEDRNGKRVEAELVGVRDGWVELQVESNRTLRVRYQSLSEPDQNYIRSRAADLEAARLASALEDMIAEKPEPSGEGESNGGTPSPAPTQPARRGQATARRTMEVNSDTASRSRAEILETLRAMEKNGKRGTESEQATAVLNAYRYLCGLAWDVETDPELEAVSLAGAKLCEAIGRLDHTPQNPGWLEKEYEIGYRGTSQGNLFAGGGGAVASVRAYMDDSNESTIQALGHRRWCLNPAMKKTGFGTSGSYSCMHAFDRSRKKTPEWEMIAFPAPGYFPSSYFGEKYAWSVTLNPDKFQPPEALEAGQVRVFTVFDSGKIGKEMELVYCGMDKTGYGVSNCIIFLPRDVDLRNGKRYRVEISNIKKKSGKRVTLAYEVEFVRD